MSIENYSEKLVIAEDSIATFINGKMRVGTLEERLSSVFSAIEFFGSKRKYTFKIVKNTNHSGFFGACVYPNLEDMNKITENVVSKASPLADITKAWASIQDWVIEIDHSCFDRSMINFNPKEIIAIILHEIGHVVYSDTVISRFYRSYRKVYTSMKSSEKEVVRLAYMVFVVPLSLSCALKTLRSGPSGRREEYFADAMVKQSGYGEYFISAFSKIVAAYGNAIIDENENATMSKIDEKVKWARLNIADVIRRKQRISTDLFMEAANSPSQYIKALYALTLSRLGINLRENYTGDAVECTIEILSDPMVLENYSINTDTAAYAQMDQCLEAAMHYDRFTPNTPAYEAIFKSRMKRGLPSWIDIDRIQLEVDRMKTHGDRSFILDMIYDKLNDIAEFLEYAGRDPDLLAKYQEEAQRMITSLNQMREQVLAKRTFEKNYRVFVNDPDGFEG